MQLHELVAAAERRLKEKIEAAAHRVIFWTRVSATSADGSADGVEGWPVDGGDPAGQQPVRRGEPWGVHGRPIAGVQALVARVMGGVASGVMAAFWTGAHGRQNLAEGETQLYCVASGCEVYLDKNGKLWIASTSGQDTAIASGQHVTIDAAGGKLIKLAGGSDFMLKGTTYRNAQATLDTAWKTFLSAFNVYTGAIAAVADPSGAATPVITAATTALTAAITAFENASSSFLSAISKTG